MALRSHPGFDPTTLVELLRWRARHEPDRLAYTYLVDGETQEINLTYQELDRQARGIGAELQKRGMKGERALLLYPPGLEYIASFFGCLYAGVVAVPAYPPRLNRPVPRIQAIVADSRAAVALTTTTILENIESRFEHSPDLAALTWRDTERLPAGLEDGWQDPGSTAEALAFLQYTSGSTSAPKGVMLSHGNLIHNLKIINHGFQIEENTVGVFWLPSYHDMGLIGGILEPLYVGEPSILMSPIAFLQRPVRWLQAISRYGGTISGAPNFAYELCVKKIRPEDRDGLDLSSWQTAFCGAEPIRAETLAQFAEAYTPHGFRPTSFYPCYGLAEGTLLVSGGEGAGLPVVRAVRRDALAGNRVVPSAADDEDSQELVGSGGSLPGQTIRIVDPESCLPCPPDRVGEIWVSGPSVAQGYWDRPEETQTAFHAFLADTGEGPFLRTGDLGFLQEGELFVTGRLKDLIIIRGRNYYPQDFEQTVESAHPALQSIAGAAFSVDQDGEERLVVVHELAREHRNADVDEVFAAVRRAIAESYDLQVYAIVLLKPHSIPMTSSGKVKRHACRAGFLDGSLEARAEWRAPILGRSQMAQPAQELPDGADQAPGEPEAARTETQRAIEEWLVRQIAARIGLPPAEIDPREPFTTYGLDSVQAVGLTGELEIWLGRSLSPTLAWDYPNIARLARHLAGETTAQPAASKAPVPVPGAHREPIAVIGLGCRFPGAPDPEAFWQLLRDGVDAVREVPPDRWAADDYYAPDAAVPGKANTRWGGFLDDISRFDPHFFGISPREAARMDPQQRLLLEVAWEALENAGIAAGRLAGSAAGVFVGISSYDYSRLQFSDIAGIDAYAGTGNAHSIAANRLSYALDLRGPSMAIDTACSSSLVAVHLAMQSLRAGESDLALAGGVNVMISPELTVTFSQARMMAADGRCKTFDARADGYVRGEGCGVIVLKRLSDALRDGDNILALLRGSAINQDGRSNGLTAPNGPSQQAVIRGALEDAAVQPAQIGYIEAHGTGTPLGDPIEIQSLRAVLEAGRPAARPYAVGSVKTNIGHLEAAAGVAGLIKVVLSLSHEEIPPHLHLEEINPYIDLDGALLEFPGEPRPWPHGEAPRLAGVSSFGFGGANAHLIVSEAPRFEEPDSGAGEELERPRHLLALSARSEEALRGLAARYERRLPGLPEGALADICFTANTGRVHFDHRLAVHAGSGEELRDALHAFLDGDSPPGLARGHRSAGPGPEVVFLFTGQGSQYTGMGRQLYETQPVFRSALDRCAELLRPELDRPLLSVLYPDPGEESPLDETIYTQPALFALEYALAELWRSWGVEPAAVLGHSVGEYVAACVAGVLSLEDGLRLIAARGRLMQGLAVKGAMAAVFAERAAVEAVLTAYPDGVSIAAINGPENIVISGEQEAVTAVLAGLESRGISARALNVSHGFHSPLMDPILGDFERLAGTLQYLPPKIPLASNLTGTILEAGTIPDAAYWRRHVREPVDFAAGMDALAEQGYSIFLEIGPNPVLTGMGRRCLAGRALAGRGAAAWLPTLRQGQEDWPGILEALGELYVWGLAVDWVDFDRGYPRRKVTLPTYPFTRERYWLETAVPPAPQPAAASAARHPLLGQQLRSPLQVHETQLDLVDGRALRTILQKMALAAAAEFFGAGAHHVEDVSIEELPPQAGPTAVVQTILTPESAGQARVEVHAAAPGENSWTRLARLTVSAGEAQVPVPAAADTGKASPAALDRLTRERLLEAGPADRAALVGDYLLAQVAAVLGIDPDRLGLNQPLDRLGFDSLMAIELKNSLERSLGVALPIVNFLEGPSIAELGEQAVAALAAPSPELEVPLAAALDHGGEHPLGYNQQSLWFLRQLVPEDVSFNVSGAVRVHGELDVLALRRAFEMLMRRHAALRTTFGVVDGQPVQRVHESLPVPFRVIDASGWSEAEILDFVTNKAHQPFDLERSPAFRVVLLHRERAAESNGSGDRSAVVLLAMDHMISDFWSISVLVREALAYYQNEAAGRLVDFQPLPLEYTDYTRWQRELLAGPAGERLLAYWKKQLGAGLPSLDLPTDRPRPPLQTFRGDSSSISLDARLAERLKALAGRQNATLFMVLLAAFQVLLHRYSGQDELIVGSVTAGRGQADLAGLAGYFINPLALRADLSDNPTFTRFLGQVRQTVLDALDHQDYPPALLAENLALPRDPSRPPLFEAMFILQKAQLSDVSALGSFALGSGEGRLEFAGLTLESLPLGRQPAQFDLTLMMAETDDRLAATLFYNTDLFDAVTARRMLGHLETLLSGLVEDPEQPVGSLNLLTPPERQDLLVAWNATGLAYPPVVGAHQLFEAQVERTPEAVAVKFEGESLTYRALNEQANRLAHHLQSLGVGPDELVGIYLDRSLSMVVALLGVLKAGGAYVPLDPDFPQERVAMMLADSRPRVLLTEARLKAALPALESRLISLDESWGEIEGQPASNPAAEIAGDNLAYLIYTSGSTGIPKGVQIPHKAMVNFLNAMRVAPGLAAGDLLLAVTTLSFDIAVLELFLPLTVGACVEVVSREVAADGAQLAEKLAVSGATVMQATPATWRLMLEAGWGSGPDASNQAETFVSDPARPGLKILCGGEALPRDLADKLLVRAAEVWNMYGPTETTVWSAIYRVQPGSGPVPVGRPIANTQVYVLDDELQPVPAGVVGELYIGGDGVARGYRDRPELTAERFITDPFRAEPHARLYRTGDLARLRADGNLMFLGRMDHQVKVRGFRIELGDIEAALAKHEAVRQPVVVAHEAVPGDVRLVAYLVLEEGAEEPAVRDLRAFLKRWLPDYMVPAAFITLEALPLTPNGKVDRRALPAPEALRPNLAEVYVAPRSEQEAAIAAICARVLGLERVGVHDDFFELGGNSLLATRLVYQLQEHFEARLPLMRLFEMPTIAGLSAALDAARLDQGDSAGLFGSITLAELEAEAGQVETLGVNGLVYKHKDRPEKILLTGATGYVGAFLLSDLLKETPAEVFCLVRADDAKAGMRRIRENLQKYRLWDDRLAARIRVVSGDFSLPRLALPEGIYCELASEVDVIYHNGALVNFVFPYHAHKQANVDGTMEILKLASETRIKPVHFVSTLAVFLSGKIKNGRTWYEDTDLSEIGVPYGGYAQSKWVAEKMIMTAKGLGIPAATYRPGPIGGHSRSGIWNEDDMICNMVKACVTLGAVPDLRIMLDVVPVDYVSKAIVHLSQQRESFGKAFNLATSQQINFTELVDLVGELGYPLSRIPFEDWKADLFELAVRDPEGGWQVFLPLINEIDMDVVSMPRFDQQNTLAGLKETGIENLALGPAMLKTYFDYFVESGVLNPPIG